jgi:hypothetical protein
VTLPTPLDDIANNCIFDAAKGELDCVNEAAMRHTLSTKRIINAEGSAIKVALFAPSLLMRLSPSMTTHKYNMSITHSLARLQVDRPRGEYVCSEGVNLAPGGPVCENPATQRHF